MAQVRFMSLLVALAWSTFTVLCVVVLSTDPSIPHNVTAVRICKGDTICPHSQCVRHGATTDCRAASLHRRGAQEEHDEEQPAEARHRLRGHHLRVDQPVQDHPLQVAAVQISTYLHTYLHIYNDISTGSDTTSPTSSPTDRTSPPLTRPSTTHTSRYSLKYIYG